MKPDLLNRVLAGLEVILVAPERAREIAGDLHDEVAEAVCEPEPTSKPEDFANIPTEIVEKTMAKVRCILGLCIGEDIYQRTEHLVALAQVARRIAADRKHTSTPRLSARLPTRRDGY